MHDRQDFVDVAMLDKFSAYYRRLLRVYNQMLTAIEKAYGITSHGAETEQFLEVAEIEIDEYVDMLLSEDLAPPNDEENAIMHTFLYALRKELGWKKLSYNGTDMLSAHELVAEVIAAAAFAWIDFRNKCRSEPKPATKRFFAEFLWEQDSSSPITLYALLAAEYAKAREILLAQPEALQ